MKELTIKEKMRLLVADTYWSTNTANGKLSEIFVTDGPCGVRSSGDLHDIRKDPTKQAICYPSPHVVANSWDSEVANDTGRAIASGPALTITYTAAVTSASVSFSKTVAS